MADKKRYRAVFDNFKGVDYVHPAGQVDKSRAVDGLNMIRDTVGTVRKRMGYKKGDKKWLWRLNGVHLLKTNNGDKWLVHSGTRYYLDGLSIYDKGGDDFSRSVQIGDYLYIADGKKILVFDGERLVPLTEKAYVPLIYINRTPRGGGKKYEQTNVLTAARREGFIADGESNEYVLSAPRLGDNRVTAVVYKDDGSTHTFSTGDGLTVNTVKATVTFSNPPPLSKITDRDNVYISYNRAVSIDNTVDKCTVLGVYGRGGKPDTLFLSGNSDHPGREWFSQPSNPFFIGENNTDVALDNNSAVMGYSNKDGKLFVHRKNGGGNLNILVRSCSGGDKNYYSYPVENALEGPGAIAMDSFVNMSGDAMFLSEKGVYAVTEKEADGRHFSQLRSYYINPSLMNKEGLDKAKTVAYKDFYVLAVGRDIYLLDTLQKSYEQDRGQSSYRYEAYHRQLPEEVRLLFVAEGRLCFATEDMHFCRFYSDETDSSSYNDNGLPITCRWQTDLYRDDDRAMIKSLHYLWIVCAAANYTGVDVWRQVNGLWKKLFSDNHSTGYFCWSKLNWAKFTWSSDRTPKITGKNIKIKNKDKIALKVENNGLNEPFGIYELGFEYTKGGLYKGG